jgi:hypothetical protein
MVRDHQSGPCKYAGQSPLGGHKGVPFNSVGRESAVGLGRQTGARPRPGQSRRWDWRQQKASAASRRPPWPQSPARGTGPGSANRKTTRQVVEKSQVLDQLIILSARLRAVTPHQSEHPSVFGRHTARQYSVSTFGPFVARRFCSARWNSENFCSA